MQEACYWCGAWLGQSGDKRSSKRGRRSEDTATARQKGVRGKELFVVVVNGWWWCVERELNEEGVCISDNAKEGRWDSTERKLTDRTKTKKQPERVA